LKYGPYIVFDGADGTGKTTLAKEVARRTGAGYVHCGPPDRPALEYYLRKLRSVEGPAVVDRLHLGSYCYGLPFRNTADLTEFEEWLIEGFLWAHGALLVYCTVPPDVVDRNLARGPDNADAVIYEDPGKRAEVRRLYEERMLTTELLSVRYDYTSCGHVFDTAASYAESMLYSMYRRRSGLPEFDALGNTVDPRLVLVADRPHWYGRALARNRGRLFMERVSGRSTGLALDTESDRHLYMALKSAGLKLGDICLFNSVQGDERTLATYSLDLPDKLLSPSSRPGLDVVALGRNAAAELSRVEAAYGYRMVPSPSHVRQVHYKDVAKYGAAISGERQWDGRQCGFCGIVHHEVKA
jgi:hypothetical protein